MVRGGGGVHRPGVGLQEPLLPRTNNANNGRNVPLDEESGVRASAPNAVTDTGTGDTDSTSSGGDDGPLIQQKYRMATFMIATLDLVITMGLAYSLSGIHSPFTFPHSFSSSTMDIVLLALCRTVWIMFQTTRCVSLRATKIAGYFSLFSLLFIITKLCSAASLSDKVNLYAILMSFSLISCIVECMYEFLVGIFSSKDLSVTVAPTASQAAQGIAVDADSVKTIGGWELLKVLRPYFWPDGLLNRICVFMTWVFLICSKASNIFAPLFIAKATDDLSSGAPMGKIVKHVVIYASLLLSNKVCKELQALAYIRVKLIAGVQLKEKVFTHLLSLTIDWHQRKSMGTVVTAMERGIGASNMVVQYIFLYLFPTFIEAIVVTVVFVETFGAPLLAAVAICGCTLYIAITVELTMFRMQYRKKMNKADNDASHKVTDALLNIETVKYFTAEEHEVQRYRESIDIYQAQAYKIQGSLSILNTSQQTVLNSTLVCALLVAAHEYNIGDFSIGQFVAVNVYVMQLFAPLNFLGSIYSMAVGSYVDLQNLCNMLAEKVDIQDKANARTLTVSPDTPLEIEFRDVFFSYPSRQEVDVLKGISFTCPAGSTTAVVGATGAGKSTITRLLFRFYEANRGRVLVGGEDVLDLTQRSLRQNLGVVPQDHILFNDTLDYNIRYGARNVDADAVRRATQAAELDKFISELPKGLDTVVGERGQQVSGGQKQRIAIARVFMKNSPVCVLDEATSSLDSKTEEQIQKALECLAGRTMLVIAHRLSTIQHADQIIVMSGGEILERGSHETLLAKGTWHEQCYASLWDKQKKAD